MTKDLPVNEEVCVVDDEAGIGDMCKDYLSDTYQVRVFTSPQMALKEFEGGYKPKLVVTDIKMPDIDGFTMVRKLHQSESRWL
jgi:CheY-like chemotaxis protein